MSSTDCTSMAESGGNTLMFSPRPLPPLCVVLLFTLPCVDLSPCELHSACEPASPETAATEDSRSAGGGILSGSAPCQRLAAFATEVERVMRSAYLEE